MLYSVFFTIHYRGMEIKVSNKIKNICFVLCSLILCFFVVNNIPVSSELTPDSKLYYGLSKNIESGVGYYDTIRNDEILPPVGHPLLLLTLGSLTEHITIIEVFVGVLALMLAVWLYTSSIIMALILLGFILLTLKNIGFLNYGIEASAFMASSLLILSFVYMYKKGFSALSIAISAILVALHILIRPVLFYPVAFFTLILAAYYLYIYLKFKTLNIGAWNFRALLIVSFLVLITVSFVSVISVIYYGDKRLTKGTYASIPLYVANNEYIPVDRVYSSDMLSKYIPKSKIESMLSSSDGWQKRQSRLYGEVIEYVSQHPKRALSGWVWRFNKYLGVGFNVSNKLFVYTIFVCLDFLLVVSLIIVGLVKKRKLYLLSSLALLTSVLLLIQIFQMMFFVWVGYRYLIPLLPFLASGVLFSLFEIKTLFNFREN